MKASELRIGNFVGFNLEDDPQNIFYVDEVAEKSMRVLACGMLLKREGDVHYFDDDLIEPIPLTEDWLLKFGSEKSQDNWGGLLIKIGSGEKIRIKNIDNNWVWPLNGHHHPKVNFVHQLQNLFFALTGAELKLQ